VHVEDAGQRFDRGADLRVDAEAAGQRQLDLPARQIEHDGDPAAAALLARDDAFEPRQRVGLADEDAQSRRRMGDDAVERLDLLRG
jgi:hypothetical protein